MEWQIEHTSLSEHQFKHYRKKHPNELAAVLSNLARYLEMLPLFPNSRSVQAGFLHPEPSGVIAIDQRGGGRGLQETRLYTYAEDDTKTVFLITVGDKQSQPGDVQIAKEFAKSIQS